MLQLTSPNSSSSLGTYSVCSHGDCSVFSSSGAGSDSESDSGPDITAFGASV